jgi:molybdopterin-guanine dinucleotide biosynthesis protein A
LPPPAAPGQGPLQGLHDVLAESPAPRVVVTAVDMPFVRRGQLAWLAAALEGMPDANGLMLSRPGPDGAARVEPFPCAFRATFAPVLAERLREGRRSLQGIAAEPTVRTAAAPREWPAETWTNLNTPADLAAFENRPRR